MAFAAGTHFGVYEITGLIGVGGMGEVYRARDTTLGREVAIKVLPDSFAADADRIARFEREAKTLASLNHANIAQIYGLERRDGTTALVMELVEGPTLAHRLMQGPIPVDEALNIAMQIADALEAAHELGIVHRDLKPANIKLRPDGTVKVLDFGIAKALSARAISGPQVPALTTPAMTEAGVVLGTAAYMSPEQARGKPVDERTDIWAFGCVLYEMLTGRPAFADDDVTTTLARVLERDPDLGALPGTIAPAVRRTIGLCLQKDPRNRIADIRDVKLAIAGGFEAGPDGGAVAVARTPRRRALYYAAAVVFGGAVVALLAWASRPAPAPRPVLSFATVLPDEYRPAGAPQVAIARDGSRIAFVTGRGPVVRNTGDLALQPVPAMGEPGAGAPCFSPDGAWIAYGAQNDTQLKKAPLAGGAALTLASEIKGARFESSCDWGEDGQVYFTSAAGLMRVAESGGRPELLAALAAGEIDYWSPQLLPDHRLLFTAHMTGANLFRAYVLNLETREKTIVLENAGLARYAPTGPSAARGHLIYGLDGALFAVPIDLRRLETGAPSAVLSGVARIYAFSFADVSSTGTLAYFAGSEDEIGTGAALTWADEAGNAVDLPNKLPNTLFLTLSPDGRRAAVSTYDVRSQVSDIWTYDLDDGRFTRLTFGGTNAAPVWTPDGKRIVYSSNVNGTGELRSVPADNSSSPKTIAVTAGRATSISSDGRLILGESSGDVWVLPVGDDATGAAPGASQAFRSVLATTFNEHDATFSPDGRFIAYASDESGRDEVYVVPYPGPGGKVADIDRRRSGAAVAPEWPPAVLRQRGPAHGRERRGDTDVPCSDAASAVQRSGAPNAERHVGTIPYSVAPDGARFLTLRPAGAAGTAAPRELRTIVNWFEELRRLAPAR